MRVHISTYKRSHTCIRRTWESQSNQAYTETAHDVYASKARKYYALNARHTFEYDLLLSGRSGPLYIASAVVETPNPHAPVSQQILTSARAGEEEKNMICPHVFGNAN